MTSRFRQLFLLCFTGCLLLCLSCEKEFIPDIPADAVEVVVEGYIESGEDALPPYLILTRSLPFFTALGSDQLDDIFIHDATVEITNRGETTPLSEICWDDFDPEEQELLGDVLRQFGFSADSLAINFCVYLDLSGNLRGRENERYDLRVETTDETLTASTTIPSFVPLDTLFFVQPAGTPPDFLRELRCFISDPADQTNFYRYLTAINSEPPQSPLGSVADDNFFNGQEFEFPLPKAERGSTEPNEFFGLYTVGDTATIKWMTFDEAHFNFWNTLEFNTVNQGPFSNYTRVESNVNGGLGIWGGYAIDYYTLIVK